MLNCVCTHLVGEHDQNGCQGNIHSCGCKAKLVYASEMGPKFVGRSQDTEELLVGCKCDCGPAAHDKYGCQNGLYIMCECTGKVVKVKKVDKPKVNLSNPDYELTNCTCSGMHVVADHDEQGCTITDMAGRCQCKGKLRMRRQAGFIPLSHMIPEGTATRLLTGQVRLKDCSCNHWILEHGELGCSRQGCPCAGYPESDGGDGVEWDSICSCIHLPHQHKMNGCMSCECRGVPKIEGDRTRPTSDRRHSSRCSVPTCCTAPMTINNPNKCVCACHKSVFSGVDSDRDAKALEAMGRVKPKTSEKVM